MIDDVVANGVTAEEVERAKNRLIADAVYAQDSQATLARWYGVALTTGSHGRERRRPGPTASAPSRRGGATPPPSAWLDKRRSVTGYLIKDDTRREEKRS